MKKQILFSGALIAIFGLASLGCDEWMVGAPCVPETDDGTFSTALTGTNYAIETRSAQCETTVCVTATIKDRNEQGPEPTYNNWRNTQLKYSFCSCRCRDAEGHGLDKNSDKYDDLCECPPSTECVSVLGNNIEDAPEKIKGYYCIPSCVQNPCVNSGEVCTPSSNSEEPWKWSCKWPAVQ